MNRAVIEALGKKDKETIDFWQNMMLKDFDSFYTYVLLEDLDEYSPDRLINTFEYFDVLVFGSDNESRIKFSWKMIQRIKNKEKNGLEDYPKVARELLALFTEIWHNAKKSMKFEFRVDEIIDTKESAGKNKKKLFYKDLFIDKQKADELKGILKKFDYLDENGKWVGQTGARNELAIAYYVLRDPAYNFQLIKLGPKKPQLITFYEEFGLQVSEKSDESAYTSIRNLTSEPTQSDTHDVFKVLFKPLRNIKN